MNNMPTLMPVADALDKLLDPVNRNSVEHVSLHLALNRTLANDISARRDQPPFPASAMDGYAVRAVDIASPPNTLRVIGEAAAGHHYSGEVKTGEAVRIFTGAPVPPGADTILIQENTSLEGRLVTALHAETAGRYVRKPGLDFATGEKLLKKGTVLDYRAIAIAASMNHATLPVIRKPKVAILATGDELVLPGSIPGPDQIIASNSFGIAAFVEKNGGETLDLGIVADNESDISAAISTAKQQDSDILVTIGGASVGDHDLVQKVLKSSGMELEFWRIAMRPGKPLIAGQLENMRVLGLPGNPVSSLVCSVLFLAPLLQKMLGQVIVQQTQSAILGANIAENDIRQEYLRATLVEDASGQRMATPFKRQDSSILSLYHKADCLIIRPPYAKAANSGDNCKVLIL